MKTSAAHSDGYSPRWSNNSRPARCRTSGEYLVLYVHNSILSSNGVFGKLGAVHIVTRSEARSDIFDYIERFYNRRKVRKLKQTDQTDLN